MAKKEPLKNLRIGVSNKRTLEFFSSIIFGLALSIGSIAMISGSASSSLSILTGIVTFGFSFAILTLTWVRFNRIFHIIDEETNAEFAINILMLFLVIIEPYLFSLLHNASGISSSFTSFLFGLDLGTMLLCLTGIYTLALRRYAKVTEKETVRYYRLVRNGLFAAALLFMISLFPIFWQIGVYGVTLREALWFAALFVSYPIKKLSQGR